MTRKSLPAAIAVTIGCLVFTTLSANAFGMDSGRQASPSQLHRACAPAQPGVATCYAIVVSAPKQPKPGSPQPPTSSPSGYGPSDIQSAYALPSTTAGSGQRVFLIEAYNDPHLIGDLATYRAQYGLPACTATSGCLSVLNQSGQTSPLPAPDYGWSTETALDTQMVSAACPLCGITVVEANSDHTADLMAAVGEATTLGGKYLSLSWGGPESSSETSYDSYLNQPGVVIAAATGDRGYGTSYPAASPYVVAVGGTTLTPAANSRGWSESAWSGAGSGCSPYEPKPSFQHDTTCSGRAIADVAAVADPNPGLAIYDSYSNGGWGVVGGTSAAAPIIASVYAMAGLATTTSSPNSYPYSDRGFMWDVTGGSNGTCGDYRCNGVAGYDGPTGVGSPNGLNAFWAPGSTGGKAGYTACSSQQGVCSGNAQVAFGVNGHFNYQTASGTLACNSQVFGDPMPGQVKACYKLDLNTSGGPSGYNRCAGEGGTCSFNSFTGTASVAFGANGQFNYRGATNSIACTNDSFGGDPAPQVVKACYYRPLSPAGGPAGSISCADEGGTCIPPGATLVAFGANGQYSYRQANGSISCDTTTFGDPIPGTPKKCYYGG